MKSIEADARTQEMLEFYLVANDMKCQTDTVESCAGHVFGAMTLAVGVVSEQETDANLAKVLRSILLGEMYYRNNVRVQRGLEASPQKSVELEHEIHDYFSTPTTREGEIARQCMDIELRLARELARAEDPTENEAYALADGVLKEFGYDQKGREVFGFYFKNRALRKTIRTGWTKNYWNVQAPRVERIADHVVSTMALALALDLYFESIPEIDRIISLLAIHEVGENLIGDFTPYDISHDEKLAQEHKAMKKMVGGLKNGAQMFEDLTAFDAGVEEWARFAHACDKLEADIQAKIYDDRGQMPPLSEQGNNSALKSPAGQRILAEIDPRWPFDVWYEADRGLYDEMPLLASVLEFIRAHEVGTL